MTFLGRDPDQRETPLAPNTSHTVVQPAGSSKPPRRPITAVEAIRWCHLERVRTSVEHFEYITVPQGGATGTDRGTDTTFPPPIVEGTVTYKVKLDIFKFAW